MRALLLGAVAAVVGLSACTEKAQTSTVRKSDTKAWDASKGAFVAPGWKGGDQASWEAQMHQRAQGQNEYTRTAAKAP